MQVELAFTSGDDSDLFFRRKFSLPLASDTAIWYYTPRFCTRGEIGIHARFRF